MHKFAQSYISKVQKLERKFRLGVVYPCSEYALLGALEVLNENLAIPVLIGPAVKIKQIAAEHKIDISNMEIIDEPTSVSAAKFAVDLVNQGKLDFLMKGSLHTDEFIRPALSSTGGLRTNRRVTHCTVMDIPHYDRPLFVADIAVNVAPDLDTKVHITQNAIDLAISLGIKDIKVAILSADEQVRGAMPSTIDAACISKMAQRGQIKGAIVDGPLAFDAAISTTAAEVKGLVSPVAGVADVLVCPSIEAGNILVKQLKYFAGAIMPGIVLGTKVPMVITSRADEALTRSASCAIAVIYLDWLLKQNGAK